MPHLVVEYTDNLSADTDISDLLNKLARKFASSDAFPVGGIRVRAIRLSEYVIADGTRQCAFVNATAKVGGGRDPAFLHDFFGEMFGIIRDHFAELMQRRLISLSLYVEELDERQAFRLNNIHAQFGSKRGADENRH